MKTEKMLVVVITLQCLILLSQWTGSPSATIARAEIMNPGERQLALLEEAKQTNIRLDKLIGIIQSGDMQVKIAKDDDKK
jgi:hypothetical protein